MLRRAFLITFGFEEKFAYRAFIQYKLHNDDIIYLITAKPIVEKVRKAMNNVRQYLLTTIGTDENLRTIEINPTNFPKAVRELKQILLKIPNDYRIILVLTGGMRSLIIELLFAAILTQINAEIFMETEDGRRINIKNVKDILALLKNLTYEERRILKELIHSPQGVSELSRKLAIPKSTVYERLKRLCEIGLIFQRDDKKYVAKEIAKALI